MGENFEISRHLDLPVSGSVAGCGNFDIVVTSKTFPLNARDAQQKMKMGGASVTLQAAHTAKTIISRLPAHAGLTRDAYRLSCYNLILA
jgi:hypothetical protein